MSSHCHPTSNCLHLSPAPPSGGCGGGGSGRESGGGRERACRERKRRRGLGLSHSVLEVRALRGSLRTQSPSPPLALYPMGLNLRECVCATDPWEGNGEEEERRDEGDLRSVRGSVRVVSDWWGDLRSVRGLCWIGESCVRSVRFLCDRWGEKCVRSVRVVCDRWGECVQSVIFLCDRWGEECVRSVRVVDLKLGYFCVWMRDFFFFFFFFVIYTESWSRV